MINLKPEVYSALVNNQALVSLLGGPRVYQMVAPNADEFPRITFFELTNFDSAFADDQAFVTEIHIQIDIWNKGSTSAIAAEVDRTMKSIGFKREASADLYEEDTKIFHKAMRYSTNREIEEE